MGFKLGSMNPNLMLLCNFECNKHLLLKLNLRNVDYFKAFNDAFSIMKSP